MYMTSKTKLYFMIQEKKRILFMWALTQLALTGWYITWVFTQRHPTNLACFLDFMSEVGPKAMKTMMEVIAGAATCGLPPIAGCATLLVTAAIAANAISKSFLNNKAKVCDVHIAG